MSEKNLTLKQALLETIELWDDMAEHGYENKKDSTKFRIVKSYDEYCPLCEYTNQCNDGKCKYCVFDNVCSTIYHQWRCVTIFSNIESLKKRKLHAKQIADSAREILNSLESKSDDNK